MPIDVTCPSCRGVLPVPDTLAGSVVRCGGCQTVVPVPAVPTAKPLARPVAVPLRRKPRPPEPEPADELPPRPSLLTRRGRAWLAVFGVAAVFGLVAFAVAAATSGPAA